LDYQDIVVKIIEKIEKAYNEKNSNCTDSERIWMQRHIILESIDRLWQEHLYAMDGLRSNISLRIYAQKDPLVEYKNEAYKIFEILMRQIHQEAINYLFRASISSLEAFERMLASMPQQLIHETFGQFGESNESAAAQEQPEVPPEFQVTFRRNLPKVGRNDDCPCGSGKKYKKCCGQ
jgi:preprotein translocase subunit SecA